MALSDIEREIAENAGEINGLRCWLRAVIERMAVNDGEAIRELFDRASSLADENENAPLLDERAKIVRQVQRETINLLAAELEVDRRRRRN